MLHYALVLIVAFFLCQSCVTVRGSSTKVYVAADRHVDRPRQDAKPSREANRSPRDSRGQGAGDDRSVAPYIKPSWVTQVSPGIIGFETEGYNRPILTPPGTLGALKLLGQLWNEPLSLYPKAVYNLRDGSWSAGMGYGLASIAEASMTGVVWPPDRFGNLRLSIKAFNTGPQWEINSRVLIRDTLQEASEILRTEIDAARLSRYGPLGLFP
jgi:hypothetical protein